MKEFVNYIESPYFLPKNEKINIKQFLKLLLLNFAISIFLGFLLIAISKITGEKLDVNQSLSLKFKFYVIFIGPILEEIYFRLLLRISKKNLIIFSVNNLFVTIFFVLNKHYFIAGMLVFINILMILLIQFKTLEVVKRFLINNFNYYFYVSAILFGILHIFNFNVLSVQVILLAFILTSKQITGGIFLGYIRMKYGIKYSMLFHSLVNLIVLVF